MKTIHTMLKEHSGRLTQDLVRSELLTQRGVTAVSFGPDRNRLSIEYDPAVIDDSMLMRIMHRYGVCHAPASPQPGAQRGDG